MTRSVRVMFWVMIAALGLAVWAMHARNAALELSNSTLESP